MKNGKIIDSDGTIKWYKDDELHCEDGPAYENHEMRVNGLNDLFVHVNIEFVFFIINF